MWSCWTRIDSHNIQCELQAELQAHGHDRDKYDIEAVIHVTITNIAKR